MLILEDLSAEIPDTNAFHWDLKKFSTDDKKVALFYGYNSIINLDHLFTTKGYKRILFNNWAPCEFAQEFSHPNKAPLDVEKQMNVIYSICPYSVEWLNNLNLGREYRSIYYPYCETLIPNKVDKKYDIIYHGGIHGIEHSNCLSVLRKFNYRFCSMTNGINQYTQNHLPLATNLNLSFRDKIKLIAETKISVCYNFVHVMPEQVSRIQKLKNLPGKNEAFDTVGTWNIMPQFKTRIHEASFSHTLNLVRKDPWNVIERYYEPDKDFIYFNDEKDLEKKIKDILGNWELHEYQNMIESAYRKSKKYTTNEFIDKIRGEV